MKRVVASFVILALAGSLLGACSSKNSRKRYPKKLYITPEDYQEDIGNAAEVERRAAQPNYESDYLFNAYPQTDPTVYFFDKHQQPKIPGEFSEKDYKGEKRLWTKPKRYSPNNTTATRKGLPILQLPKKADTTNKPKNKKSP